MTGPRRDPYAILGVSPGASRTEIAATYRRLAKRTHPDVGGATASAMQDLNWAWNLLSNPGHRADWDRSHAGAGAVGSHWSAGSPAPQPQPAEANWRTPPPWTVSGEPWAGVGAPAVAQRSGIGCVGILLIALALGTFVLFGALTTRPPALMDEPGASPAQVQVSEAPP